MVQAQDSIMQEATKTPFHKGADVRQDLFKFYKPKTSSCKGVVKELSMHQEPIEAKSPQ